ncbi:acyltransferase family protein [Hoeflea sp. E7-10]|uniref:Acyltransferase family protein n=2 Tax=Hoeflea poritis TaxID=2993659 RepID=A0ABT4VRS6_9HYPH|nr:acyltransferase family protein [Hoeflea poritis]MDA4847412.1 acyltransferase family protein [Hoeflea poritis]
MRNTPRWHGLDLLRAVAMLLGLVIHACLPFTNPGVNDWVPAPPYDVPEAHWIIWLTTMWIHVWRMPVFMLLGGFFTELVLQKRGPGAFLRDRLLRVLSGMALFSMFFSLVMKLDWGVLDYLWFLWILFLFSLMAAVAHWLRLTGIFHCFRWFSAHPARLIWLVLPITLANYVGRSEGLISIIPYRVWDEPFTALATYVVFFWLGQCLFHHQGLLSRFKDRNLWIPLLITGLVLLGCASAIWVARPLGPDGTKLAMSFLTACLSLSWSFCAIGFALYALTVRSAFVDWMVLLSYPVYVLHFYPIVILTGLLVSLGASQGLAILGGIVLCFALCAAIYLLFLRWTPVDWVLSGYSKSRFTTAMRSVLAKLRSGRADAGGTPSKPAPR